jgi:hypothetical protein
LYIHSSKKLIGVEEVSKSHLRLYWGSLMQGVRTPTVVQQNVTVRVTVLR